MNGAFDLIIITYETALRPMTKQISRFTVVIVVKQGCVEASLAQGKTKRSYSVSDHSGYVNIKLNNSIISSKLLSSDTCS